MHIIDKSFTEAPRSYIIQSLLAVVTVVIIFTFVEVLTHAAIVAALGSRRSSFSLCHIQLLPRQEE